MIIEHIDSEIELHESLGLKAISIDICEPFYSMFIDELNKIIECKTSNIVTFNIESYKGIPINFSCSNSKNLSSNFWFHVRSINEN